MSCLLHERIGIHDLLIGNTLQGPRHKPVSGGTPSSYLGSPQPEKAASKARPGLSDRSLGRLACGLAGDAWGNALANNAANSALRREKCPQGKIRNCSCVFASFGCRLMQRRHITLKGTANILAFRLLDRRWRIGP